MPPLPPPRPSALMTITRAHTREGKVRTTETAEANAGRCLDDREGITAKEHVDVYAVACPATNAVSGSFSYPCARGQATLVSAVASNGHTETADMRL